MTDSSHSHTPVLISGCGYLGQRLGCHWIEQGRPVHGLVRSAASAEALRSVGIRPWLLDLDDATAPTPEALAAIDGGLLYHLAPPPPRGREDSRSRHLLSLLDGCRPQRVVLVSTSGVYGDCGGDWVDESRPPAPHEDRAWRRLDAERQWQTWCEAAGAELAVLRVAGIYGPGRLPEARLQRGEPVLLESESPWSNRIHIHDLLRVAVAAGRTGAATGLFNVADGCPGTMTDYFNRVADHLGLPRPAQISLQQATEQLSPGMLGYLRESRRLSIRRLREELGVTPELAGLDKGLAACRQPQ